MPRDGDSGQVQLAQEKEAQRPNKGGTLRGLSRPHKAHRISSGPRHRQAGLETLGIHVAAHLPCVEFCIWVWEARELPGAAIEVHIAGSKGGKKAQVVIHWKTQAGIREVAL